MASIADARQNDARHGHRAWWATVLVQVQAIKVTFHLWPRPVAYEVNEDWKHCHTMLQTHTHTQYVYIYIYIVHNVCVCDYHCMNFIRNKHKLVPFGEFIVLIVVREKTPPAPAWKLCTRKVSTNLPVHLLGNSACWTPSLRAWACKKPLLKPGIRLVTIGIPMKHWKSRVSIYQLGIWISQTSTVAHGYW